MWDDDDHEQVGNEDEEAKEVNKGLNALEYLKIFEMMTIMNMLAMKMRRQRK